MARKITLLRAIQILEKACLSKDSSRTTGKDIKENGKKETREYYLWLRRQAPTTAMGLPLEF